MSAQTFVAPVRPAIADPSLRRPDWTQPGARDPKLLWLDKNENTDPELLTITRRVLAEIDPLSVAIYPDCEPLYRALARHLGVDAHSIIVAPGSDGVIGSTFRALIDPGDRVLHTDPTYAMYPVYARISGATTDVVEYEPSAAGPVLSLDRLIERIRAFRPKLVCLPNPDSPTGTVLDLAALRTIFAECLNIGAVVQIDEAYHPFHSQTVLPFVSEFPNLIVVRTFSKAWGLTGIRLGYGVTAPETATLLHKVRPNYEVNQVAVALAVRMLNEFEAEMEASVRRLNDGRDRFRAAMDRLGLRTLDSHGCFTHVAFGAHSARVHAGLSDLVLYRREFNDPSLRGFSRFSATTAALFAPVIDRITRIVTEAR